jgi:DNA-binding HxlR family transcriptional regulator
MTKGLGKYQIEQEEKALKSILDVLSDEKEHRNKDIKKKTGLNDVTLTKHLKKLKEMKLIERNIDRKSDTYPIPVYYKINPMMKAVLEVISTTEQEKHEIEKILLNPKKTPLDVLDQISIKNNELVLLTLKLYKENKDVSPKLLNLMLELYVWQPYARLTSFLIEESKKIINKIDVESLIESNKSTIRLGKNDLKSIGLTDEMIAKMLGD